MKVTLNPIEFNENLVAMCLRAGIDSQEFIDKFIVGGEDSLRMTEVASINAEFRRVHKMLRNNEI